MVLATFSKNKSLINPKTGTDLRKYPCSVTVNYSLYNRSCVGDLNDIQLSIP